MSSVLGRGKSQREPSPVNMFRLRHDYGFVFGQKLTHKLVRYHDIKYMIGFWRIIYRNRRITDLRWPYDLVARIHYTPRHCNRRKQWAKPSHLTKLDVPFSVLALRDASIGMIGLWFQYHSHSPMIRQIWIVVERRQHLMRDAHAKLFLLKI